MRKVSRVVLSLALVAGFTLAAGIAVRAADDEGGPDTTVTPAVSQVHGILSINLTCEDGVSTTTAATFAIKFGSIQLTTVAVTCGQTVAATIPPRADIGIGVRLMITQLTAPTNGEKAADVAVTLLPGPQTISINNKKSATATTPTTTTPTTTTPTTGAPATRPAARPARLARTGGGPDSWTLGALIVLGVLLVGAGATLLVRRSS